MELQENYMIMAQSNLKVNISMVKDGMEKDIHILELKYMK